jgi:DNA mismatch repair protein MutL
VSSAPRIGRLPETLVNQIAAGEVVERPASVLKELCENALDAEAHHITVDLQAGGTREIQVSDDGTGMGPEDARLALERHATSKLHQEADLLNIATLGFRGEALPAIASVSHFTLVTRERGTDGATEVKVSGGEAPRVSETAAPVGTRVLVQDLFFNTPARRKFLKRPQTESAHATEVVTRLMLARPDVGFTLRCEGRTLLSVAEGTGLRERVALALGKGSLEKLVEVDERGAEIELSGFVGSPDLNAATGQKVWLFVNGRAIRDRALAYAVSRAYQNLLPPGRFPMAVVFVKLPLDRVDVNVHPQKAEVRFADARAVHDAVARGLGRALRPAPWLGVREGEVGYGRANVNLSSWTPLPSLPRERWTPTTTPTVTPTTAPTPTVTPTTTPTLFTPLGYFSSLRFLGQLAQTYLVCESTEGALVVLDQHAAHERVLFERLRTSRAHAGLRSQRLLLPAVIELGVAELATLVDQRERLASLGFEIEPFDGRSLSVTGVPLALIDSPIEPLLHDLAEQLAGMGSADAGGDAEADLLATMACHAAVRAHDPMSEEHVRALLGSLDSIDYKVRCPHGRPVVTQITRAELERRVERR